MSRPFRFAVNMLDIGTAAEWRQKCRRAEALGYDVILVPDHLGMPAPFPSLVAAAEATERPRVGTFVLNAGFYSPALLAREVATTDRLTGGRLELGLGTGYVKAEHDAAGLPFGSPRERVDRLERTITELKRLLDDPEHAPRPAQSPQPPLLLGGNGNRVLRLSARHADIAAFTGGIVGADGALRLTTPDELDERVAAYHSFAADRTAPVELNYLVQHVTPGPDRHAAARGFAPDTPGLTDDELLSHPALLSGTTKDMAEQLLAHRERYGFSYYTVLEPALDAFAPVIEELRGA
ncbi:LLM class F420-dependent oxidoreductase [Streptomyces sp. AV19]|uniref:LLM class F420-dependent oxidoreductase n=1 Tax=Streptomyces sp. AV19 TaxID=2793068 RepID=UPI0018FE25F9|nr:LLM class F420-dependent oxidoreductase [Streptomyces sp. AV19]MBH1937981.1 LLM class F420-dependent oxidoreductase [Streptomyces sp. AV19]MDG4536597.1 LLM class F420-dependent oxidoreductase [Streptomyces sp. AV19]